MSLPAVAALREELDRLAAEGRSVGFWWRDDDAAAATPALDRLLAVAGEANLPVSLAAIPAHVEPSLPERLREEKTVTVLVHGWSHADHARPDAKKAEFGPGRPLGDARRDAVAARASIRADFGPRALAVFVPPWNRIAPEIAALLPALGYRGLSCFGAPGSGGDFIRLDTHLDPVDWHGSRSLAEPRVMVAMMRRAIARGADTIGLLTHHLMFDEALWSFTAQLAALVAGHPAARPMGFAELLPKIAPEREAVPA